MLSQCVFRPTPSTSRQPPTIRLRCRDFTFVTFNFSDNETARETFDFIKARTCKLGSVDKLYAFSHKPIGVEMGTDTWCFYDPRAEFRRQGISEKLPDKGWRITCINRDYSLCDTYPALLVVPSKISDNVLKYAREFRSKNRIPVLSYIHPVNNCTITRSSQPRSGLTRRTNVQDERLVAASFSAWIPEGAEDPTPPNGQSEVADESTLSSTPADLDSYADEMVSRSSVVNDEKAVYGRQQANMIVDARPTMNAMANQIQGLGSENMVNYKFATKAYLNIENIHVMRKSLNKVVEALKDADISPLPPNRELLQQSNWLSHIHSVLGGAITIARRVGIDHSHVLIHCSDGWDRTSQLSALSQIMLDPYFRTIDGFIVLVEKDWLSFGHRFRQRSGHLNHDDWFTVQRDALAGSKVQPGENDGRNDALQNVLTGARRFFNQSKEGGDSVTAGESTSIKTVDTEATVPDEVSPVFHQFLDCTYQLLRQDPNRFEYNERFLRRLLYHVYSCQYGTFLYNSEKQRREARVYHRTFCVWDYFLSRRPEWTNPDFDPVIDDRVRGKERILLPNLKEIRWWYQLFGRTDDEMNGSLNATAAAESRLAAAVSNLQDPSRPEDTPPPPGLDSSQPVVTAIEKAHQILTPEGTTSAAHRSASADRSSALAAIRNSLSSINISSGVRGNLGLAQESQSAAAASRTEQEMSEMA
ncbi:protein phosphatase [Moelleriella libera RCEF 2490]|uniref:Protein phosphatase n=1 Tax=Moelleriella libera RCEF 2490 TaxID=1081109 RepID=A0A168EYI7_9HYPO|nr:protein phosphatase [Moelleriella libera RCEF 2490]